MSNGQDWTLQRIQSLISDEVEESLSLEYKSARALSRTDEKSKDEISKDVSSFANSAGGIIIYGICEKPGSRHLPDSIDSVLRSEISKEWLEQIISSRIAPRIDGIKIAAVSIPHSEKRVVYVVEIPQSTTAHQARDHKYYKRRNFERTPMEDYEIRDVMNRSKYPQISLDLYWSRSMDDDYESGSPLLVCELRNQGTVTAHYAALRLHCPWWLYERIDFSGFEVRPVARIRTLEEVEYYEAMITNFDHSNNFNDDAIRNSLAKPILPGLYFTRSIPFQRWLNRRDVQESHDLVRWEVFADNAPVKDGHVKLSEIRWIHDFDNPPPEYLHEPGVILAQGDEECRHEGFVRKHQHAFSYIAVCSLCGRQATGRDAEDALAVLLPNDRESYRWHRSISSVTDEGAFGKTWSRPFHPIQSK